VFPKPSGVNIMSTIGPCYQRAARVFGRVFAAFGTINPAPRVFATPARGFCDAWEGLARARARQRKRPVFIASSELSTGLSTGPATRVRLRRSTALRQCRIMPVDNIVDNILAIRGAALRPLRARLLLRNRTNHIRPFNSNRSRPSAAPCRRLRARTKTTAWKE